MGYKLLLADDSITIQKVVGIIFANEDYELTVTDNGNDALDKARNIVPDMMMIDALMPGKSGYDVCREARQDPILADVPILLLVGAFEPFDEEKARNSGADDHIAKPFESQQLIEKVRKLIEFGRERAMARKLSSQPGLDMQPSGHVPSGGEADLAEGLALDSVAADAGRVEAASHAAAEPVQLSSLDIVEADPEDDLWGVFATDEIAEGEDIQLGEVIEEEEFPQASDETVEEIEPFVFAEEETEETMTEPFAREESVSTVDFAEPEPGVPFIFRGEAEKKKYAIFSSDHQAEVSGAEIDLLADEETVSVVEMPEEPSPSPTFVFSSPEEEQMPSTAEPSSTREAQEAAAAEPVKFDAASISEAQLAEIVAKISRDIIEKIAWEVVPDLAESMIREEIRKIREGC